MNIAGRKSTAGFSGDLLNAPAAKHGLPEQIMQEAGAGIFTVTLLSSIYMVAYILFRSFLLQDEPPPGNHAPRSPLLLGPGAEPVQHHAHSRRQFRRMQRLDRVRRLAS
jgi:hypothetical protein